MFKLKVLDAYCAYMLSSWLNARMHACVKSIFCCVCIMCCIMYNRICVHDVLYLCIGVGSRPDISISKRRDVLCIPTTFVCILFGTTIPTSLFNQQFLLHYIMH